MPKPQGFIFDVDGTLYDHGKLKRLMLARMAAFLLRHPSRAWEIAVVRAFRKVREELSVGGGEDLERLQYERTAARVSADPSLVRQVVDKWMFTIPLPYLRSCMYPGVSELLTVLKELGIRTAVFSDYPCADKMRALGLEFDCLADAQDPEIDRLKPDPRGLFVVAQRLGVPVRDCLFIGDRDDKDGECARRAGMDYAILERGLRLRPSPNGFTSYGSLMDRFYP